MKARPFILLFLLLSAMLLAVRLAQAAQTIVENQPQESDDDSYWMGTVFRFQGITPPVNYSLGLVNLSWQVKTITYTSATIGNCWVEIHNYTTGSSTCNVGTLIPNGRSLETIACAAMDENAYRNFTFANVTLNSGEKYLFVANQSGMGAGEYVGVRMKVGDVYAGGNDGVSTVCGQAYDLVFAYFAEAVTNLSGGGGSGSLNYSGFSNNASTTTPFNGTVTWKLNLSSSTNLSHYRLAWDNATGVFNGSGAYLNQSPIAFAANTTSIWLNITATKIPSRRGQMVGLKVWANDTRQINISTTESTYITANTAPVTGAPSLNNTGPGLNFSILCQQGTYSDVDVDVLNLTNTSWFVNGSLRYQSFNATTPLFLNASVGSLIVCGWQAWDGYAWSLWQNSTAATVINTLPSVTVYSPTPGSSLGQNRIQYNWSGADIDNQTLTYYLYHGDSVSSLGLLSAGAYTTYLIDGLHNGTYYFQINVTDGVNTSGTPVYNVTILSPVLRINATTAAGVAISAFSVNISSVSYRAAGSTTSGAVLLNASYELYNYTVTASGYTDVSGQVSMTQDVNMTVTLLKPNSVNIQVYYDANYTLAADTAVALQFISSSYVFNVSTSTGTYYADYLPSGDYALEYSTPGYWGLRYYFTVNNTVAANMNLYLIPSTATPIVITLFSSVGNTLIGYDIVAQKLIPGQSSYAFNQMGRTDASGNVIMYFTPYVGWYKFVIQHNGAVLQVGNPRPVSADFTIFLQDASQQGIPQLGGIAHSLNYSATLGGYFTYTWQDVNGLSLTGCLKIQQPLSSTILYYSCQDTVSGSISVGYNSTNSSGALATGSVFWHGTEYVVEQMSVNLLEDYAVFGSTSVLIVILLVICLALSFAWHPALGLIAALMGFLVSAAMGFIKLSYTEGAVFAIGVIIVVVLAFKVGGRANG